MVEHKRVFRIVAASPSDVRTERDALEAAISELNQFLRDAQFPAILELYRWETDAYPGLHENGPQGLIDSRLRIEESDVLIGIFWNRLGTPTGDSRSGTEHEIRKAIEARKTKGSPQVMLYFNKAPYRPNSTADVIQLQALYAFKEDLLAKEAPLVWEYDPVTFTRDVQSHLRKFIFEQLREGSSADKPLLRYRFAIEPVLLRAEGITELLGNGYLYCNYNSPVPPTNQLWFSVILYFVTQVTSRLNDSTFGHTAGEHFMLEVGRPGCEQSLIRCTAISGNMVAFGQVHLEYMQPFETRISQIGNIRCNAFGVWYSGVQAGDVSPGDKKLLGTVSVSSATVENDSPIFATARWGLEVEVRTVASAPRVTPVMLKAPTTSTLFPVGILRFS